METSHELISTRERLHQHPLYRAVTTPAELRRFAERHVFAVWDFMTLLKSLQRDLTGLSLPWVPARDPEAARLVNELVLAEESEVLSEGRDHRHGSHFEWYLEAMDEIGANRAPIDAWVTRVRRGGSFREILAEAQIPTDVRAFLEVTAGIIEEPLAVRAAAFHYSRESLIPQMFIPIISHLSDKGLACETLLAYLRRHVALDSDEHSHASELMATRLLAAEPRLDTRATEIALRALKARAGLWDAILAGFSEESNSPNNVHS